jgi:hypothetical protein
MARHVSAPGLKVNEVIEKSKLSDGVEGTSARFRTGSLHASCPH